MRTGDSVDPVTDLADYYTASRHSGDVKLIGQIALGVLLGNALWAGIQEWRIHYAMRNARAALPEIRTDRSENRTAHRPRQVTPVELPPTTITAQHPCEIVKADGTRHTC
jgi:hypothetical protein